MGLSVKVPMLEAEGCATESETCFPNATEPAAAGGGGAKTHSFTVHCGYNLMHLNKEIKQDIYLLLIVLLALS